MALKEKTKSEQSNTYELTVEVDGETFEKAVNAVYKKQVKNINIQGFRKGKAPRALIEKMYGSEVFYEEAINNCYPEALYEASKEAEVKIVKTESIEPVEAGKSGLTFKAVVIVEPTMEINNYLGMGITKKSTEVTDELIDAEVEKVRERNSRLVTVSDRAAENGDTAVIDYEGFTDGVAFDGGKGENYNLKLGSGSFIPGFEEQIVGHNSGEEFSITVKFPEDYQAEDLKGKEAEFKIVLHEIKATELPDVDDDFVKDVSEKETVEEWKKELGETVAKRLADESEKDVDNQIADKLIELLEGEIPQAMFDNQSAQMVEDFDRRLRSQGLDLDTYVKYMGIDPENIASMYNDEAEKRVRLRLALETIARKENIQVSDSDLDDEYSKMAQTYKMEIDQVKAAVPAESLTEDIKVQKALELVKEKAEIK